MTILFLFWVNYLFKMAIPYDYTRSWSLVFAKTKKYDLHQPATC